MGRLSNRSKTRKMSDSESDNEEFTIANDLVVTKYKMAGDIANRVLKNLIERCVLGVSALELCKIGDDMIVQETDKVYKKEKEIQKGIAFPTQANINNWIWVFTLMVTLLSLPIQFSCPKKRRVKLLMLCSLLTPAPKQPFDWSHLVLRTLKSQTLYQKFPS